MIYVKFPQLFPSSARFVYMYTEPGVHDLYNFDNLHPLEQIIVSQSVPKRRAEFADARWCAHEALKELGMSADEPILKGERGMPLWPRGIAGALTHTDGFRAAVVAPTTSVRSIGLDVEPAEVLPEGVLETIARKGEYAQLDRLRANGVQAPDRLLFCAKEATYKAWFPITKRWLGFEQAEIDLRDDGTFISYLLVRPTPVPFIEGRWMIKDGFVLTSTFIS